MENEILAILKELRPEFDYPASNDFVHDGLLDSFDLISLVSILEEKYHVFIDALEILPENFSSVEAISALVARSGNSA